MKSRRFLVFILGSFILLSCKKEGNNLVEKKYWDANDYATVINEIKYNSNPDEKLPTFDNPETSKLLEKLTDEDNFKIVLDDSQLGVKHRSEVAQKFFDEWKKMSDIYTEIDRTDKYLYEVEFVKIWNFGLELQLRYFKLGNDAVVEKSDDPNSESVKGIKNSNINVLVNNMLIYLDEINNEKSYSEVGLKLISDGIDKSFTELVNVYPTHNYENLLKKTNLMLNKSKSENIKISLTKLKTLIESKKTNEVEQKQ